MTDPQPENTWEYKSRGDDLAKKGDFPGAIDQYRKAIDADPANIPAWNNLSVSYRRLGRTEEAEQALARKYELLHGQAADDLKKKGDELAEAGDYEGAVGFYQKAVELDPQNASAQDNLNAAYAHLGRTDETVSAGKTQASTGKVENETPGGKKSWSQKMAGILGWGKEITKARAIQEPAVPAQGPADVMPPGIEEAITRTGPAAGLPPTREESTYQPPAGAVHRVPSSDELLERLGSRKDVLPATEPAIPDLPAQDTGQETVEEGPATTQEPPHAPDEGVPGYASLPGERDLRDYPTPDDLRVKGDELAEHGYLEAAIEYYRQAIWIDPRNIPAWNNLGNVYRQLGRLDSSEECRLQVRELSALHRGEGIEQIEAPPVPGAVEAERPSPDSGSPRTTPGRPKEPRRRPEDIDSATELKAEGDRLARNGAFETAIGYYQRAIELNPGYIPAWNNLGYCYYHLGMIAEANRCRARKQELLMLVGMPKAAGEDSRPPTLQLDDEKVAPDMVIPGESWGGRIGRSITDFIPGMKGANVAAEPAPPQEAQVTEPSPPKPAIHLQAPTMQTRTAPLARDALSKKGMAKPAQKQPDLLKDTTIEPRVRQFQRLKFMGKQAKKTGKMLENYNPAVHGNLVEESVSPEYEPVDEYWIDEGRAHVRIMRNTLTNQNEYLLFEPALSQFEYELLERLYEDLRDVLILKEEELAMDRKSVLFSSVQDLLDEYGLKLDDTTLFKLQYFIQRNFLGWLRIDALMKDPHIEDISCDGIGVPIFLYHRKYRNIKTNITFDETDLNSLAITLAQRSGKHISIGNPMIGATLPDGSRLQLSLGTEVTTRGTSFTIRKFREVPFTPVELMSFNTFDIETLVYFWVAIENNKSLLFVGGTASGKTTSLNAVSLFIPPLAKIVSIEDTREITLYHENWIATVTRESVAEGMGTTILMFDLLKAAMRQRPEFIIVGEVRGVEAQTLFQAMNTGHTTFSTMHAGGVDAAIHRLESEPLNVPRTMIQALNIVSVQALIHREGERVRRCLEVVELAGIDPVTGNIQVNTVFEYDPIEDRFHFSGRSLIYHDIMAFHGWTPEQFEKELSIRRRILTAMLDQDLTDYVLVSSIIEAFGTDRELVERAITNLREVIR